jgi:biotin synthesis protein BioG
MRREWLIREGGDHLTLFFGGWGLDVRAVNHLAGSGDVLMFYDYREIAAEGPPDTTGYAFVDVVAWSMGVWAAALLLSRWGLSPRCAVALNGTERPVDDRHGIPLKLYLLTERGMDERGRARFIARMLGGKEERATFSDRHEPRRELGEQVEELRRVREQASCERPEMKWDRVFISREDSIFPVENQQNWWQDRGEITYLAGGHYPFFQFSSWESITDYGNR